MAKLRCRMRRRIRSSKLRAIDQACMLVLYKTHSVDYRSDTLLQRVHGHEHMGNVVPLRPARLPVKVHREARSDLLAISQPAQKPVKQARIDPIHSQTPLREPEPLGYGRGK